MAYKPSERISSSRALRHPTFTSRSPLAKLGSAFNKAGQVQPQRCPVSLHSGSTKICPSPRCLHPSINWLKLLKTRCKIIIAVPQQIPQLQAHV